MNIVKRPTITIIGSGYVGTPAAAILANAGFQVYVLEIQPSRLEAIQGGRSFFYEESLDPLLEAAVSSGKLIATDSYATAIPASDIVFSCVGTPDNADGSSNLSYVFAAAREAAEHARPGTIFVQKSTVPVGTGREILAIFDELDADLEYVSNPEFLRESTALRDTLWFDRIVVGGDETEANQAVLGVYKQMAKARSAIAKKFGVSGSAHAHERYIETSLQSAELIKVSANAFLALKISFANSIAKLADATDADVTEVMDGIGADPRIGRAFLNAGRGYGGGCFPKDVSGLISSGLKHSVDLQIMHAARDENNSMPGYILEKMLQRAELGTLVGKKVAVLGLAFKAGTSDVRKSPAIRIANLLVDKLQADVYAYDPEACRDDDRDNLYQAVQLCPTLRDAITGAEAVIVATDWAEIITHSPKIYAKLMKGKLFVDAMNVCDKSAIQASGLIYIGVGR